MRSFVPFRARHARHGLGVLVLAMSMVTTGCEFITGVPSVKRVDISLIPDTLPVGAIGQANGTAIGKSDNAITSSKVRVAYQSSNPAVATVNQTTGQVIAIGEGTADIIATSRGKSARAAIVVTQALPVRAVPTTFSVEVGKTLNLNLQLYDAQNRALGARAVAVTSSAPGIASVAGTTSATVMVTGVSPGNANLNIVASGNTFTIPVTVSNPGAATLGVTLQKGGNTLLVGESTQLVPTFKDAAGNVLSPINRPISFSITDQTVASVTPAGVITGVKPGTARITLTEVGTGISGTLDLTVTTVPVKFLTFSNSNPVFRKGAPRLAEAVALDSANNRLNRVIAYTSSNPAVISINPTSGIATPSEVGTATITAKIDNLTTTMDVRVTLLPIGQVVIQPLNAQVYPGETVQYTATVTDSLNGIVTDRKPSWSSSATSIATINATTGLATATGPGQTFINAVMERVPGEGVPAGQQVALTVLPTRVDTITVSNASVTVARGANLPVTVITRDAAGTQLFGRTVIATPTDAGIAAVSSITGSTLVIQGISAGTTTIVLQAVNSAGIAEGKKSVITVTVTSGG